MSFARERARRGRARRDWRQYPIFVYGTLRRGQVNYSLYLKGLTIAEMAARIDSMALYSLGTFPVMITTTDTQVGHDQPLSVVGEVMFIQTRSYDRVLADLDYLEGIDPRDVGTNDGSLFRRVRRLVTLETGAQAIAWLYVGDRRALMQYDHVLLPDGDWMRYQRERARRFATGSVDRDRGPEEKP